LRDIATRRVTVLRRMNTAIAGQTTRTHDPFAMQKVVGSSPIIRSTKGL